MIRTAYIIILTALIIYAALCSILYIFQRSLLYFPQARGNISGIEVIHFQTGGVILNISALQRHNTEAVIYFGGNAEDASASLPTLEQAFPGKAIYAMHYRGYGGSEGKPSESVLVQDALSLLDDLSKKHSSIILAGRSLGSGVATQLASQRHVAKLILITPYDSIENIAANQFPLFPIGLLLQDKFESWKHAKLVTAPTLIIAAEYDEVIPRKNTERLFKEFQNGLAQFKIVHNTGHNTISNSAEYIQYLTSAQ
jgi:pimeloyl-ACP methyl ester carboxylesterase